MICSELSFRVCWHISIYYLTLLRVWGVQLLFSTLVAIPVAISLRFCGRVIFWLPLYWWGVAECDLLNLWIRVDVWRAGVLTAVIATLIADLERYCNLRCDLIAVVTNSLPIFASKLVHNSAEPSFPGPEPFTDSTSYEKEVCLTTILGYISALSHFSFAISSLHFPISTAISIQLWFPLPSLTFDCEVENLTSLPSLFLDFFLCVLRIVWGIMSRHTLLFVSGRRVYWSLTPEPGSLT